MRRRYWFPKPYADLVARLRVPSGFLLVVVFALFSHPTESSLLEGLPLSVAGLWLRGWAAGHLAKNTKLATSGPYRYTRNPLYLGTLLVALGLVTAARNWILGLLFAAVFVLVYLPVIELEEQHLRQIFPDYDGYAERVPLLLPVGRLAPSGRPYRWALYKKNQEYQALLGYLAGFVYLVWKARPV